MIEHHGGPKRLVRVSATVRPSTSVVWIEALLGLTSGCLGMLRFFAPAMLLGALFCVLWLAAVWHANCLELAIVVNMAEVAEELVADVDRHDTVDLPTRRCRRSGASRDHLLPSQQSRPPAAIDPPK